MTGGRSVETLGREARRLDPWFPLGRRRVWATDATDRELWRRADEGDAECFGVLLDRHAGGRPDAVSPR